MSTGKKLSIVVIFLIICIAFGLAKSGCYTNSFDGVRTGLSETQAFWRGSFIIFGLYSILKLIDYVTKYCSSKDKDRSTNQDNDNDKEC